MLGRVGPRKTGLVYFYRRPCSGFVARVVGWDVVRFLRASWDVEMTYSGLRKERVQERRIRKQRSTHGIAIRVTSMGFETFIPDGPDSHSRPPRFLPES